MKKFQRLAGTIAIATCGALTACTTYVERPQSREVYVPAPQPVYVAPPEPVYERPAPIVVAPPTVSVGVVIQSEDDFYEPLTPYGTWEVVPGYGRCWIPRNVDRNWRPYCNGNWERTDAGWYWQSDEPWAWATYHYGRWDLSPQFGWYWVPQTQWSPAWVSWHEGGGYVGWAPLQPNVRFSGGAAVVNVAVIAPQAYVFVEPRHFMQPVRPTTMVINNTTIINKTVNITNVKIVNNTVINEGPRTQIIEQASGKKVRSVPVRELRQKQEAAVVVRKAAPPVAHEKIQKNVPPPFRAQSQPQPTTTAVDAQRRANEAEARAQEQLQRNVAETKRAALAESQKQTRDAAAKAQQQATLEKAAQLEAQRSAAEAKRVAVAESQKQAREAAVKAQQQARLDAKEAQRKTAEAAALRPVSPRAQVPAPTLHGGVLTQPTQALQQPHGKQNTNAVKRVQQKNGKKFQPAVETPVVVPAPVEPISDKK
ncbi:MAG: hypothetical protein JWO95_628 [Verrucomicrobiales bacterium]|nr:hypothetical protein [Verrucomicrobiales bacterium]